MGRYEKDMSKPAVWALIKSRGPTLSTMIKPYRFGMLSSVKGGTICLACRGGFQSWMDAQTHPCPDEDAFREVTGRHVKKGPRGPYKKRLPVATPHCSGESWAETPPTQSISIDPEHWIRWNAGLLEQIAQLKESLRVAKSERDTFRNRTEALSAQVDKLRVVPLNNEQARAYEEYARR